MQPTDLLILALACYVITDVLVNRAAPFGIMARIRDRMNTELLRCMYCAGLWVGIAVYLAWRIEPQVIYPLAIAGGALMLWRYTGGNHA